MTRRIVALLCILSMLLTTACASAPKKTEDDGSGQTAGVLTPTVPDPSVKRAMMIDYTGAVIVPEKTHYTLQEIAAEAEYIVVADVQCLRYDQEIDSAARAYAKVTILETLKGTLSGTVVVSDCGLVSLYNENGIEFGEYDDASIHMEETVLGEPRLRKNNRVLLFLHTGAVTDKGVTVYDVLEPMNKFFWDTDGLYHNSLCYSAIYANYLETGEIIEATDFPLFIAVPDTLEPISLDDVRAAIAATADNATCATDDGESS